MKTTFTIGWQNKGGTGNRDTCRCGSWKNHWLRFSGSTVWPLYCCVSGCYNYAEDGGHAINDYQSGEWILPMCKKHNNPNYTDKFSISSSTYIASANRGDTCGY